MTENGEKQSRGTGEKLVGRGKLIDPAKLAHVFCSPAQRATKTLDLLLGADTKATLESENKLSITNHILEWDYGTYGPWLSVVYLVEQRGELTCVCERGHHPSSDQDSAGRAGPT